MRESRCPLTANIRGILTDDPQVQHSYRLCAERYGSLIAPCRVRTPQHKGKVEPGGVHYLKRNFLGGREPTHPAAGQSGLRAPAAHVSVRSAALKNPD